MPEQRDTRVETLRAGDQMRYYGEWFDVVRIQSTDTKTRVAVTLDRPMGEPVEMVNLNGDTIRHQAYLTTIFPPGHMVAAECQVRS